jgi:hypothetical protein
LRSSFLDGPAIVLCLAVLLFSPCSLFAQSLSGYVLNADNEPVPYVTVFIRQLQTGTSTDHEGKYFLTLQPGIYDVVFSSVGYVTKTAQVIIRDKPVVKNIWIASSTTQLDQITVKASRRDPAYEIIQFAIKNKDKYLSQVTSSKTNVYVRAGETVDEKEKKKREEENQPEDLSAKGPPIDPFEAALKKEEARLQKINLLEMNLVLNYQYPDRYKEERTAYKAYGSRDGLFIPIFSQADFNFYHNLVDLKGIAEIPVISPLSRTSILSYKFKLEETLNEDSVIVYKIKVTPRKTGDATCRGFIYINDSTWNINRLELSLHKGGLRFYDEFLIRQTYNEISENLWIPTRQEFEYETKSGAKTFRGNTVIVYSDFQNDFPFPPKFFGNEVAITTKEAYDKDSSYWNSSRPEPLTTDQQKVVAYRDSIEAAHKNKKYLDSIQAKYNKITLGELLYNDLGFRNDSTKRNLYISSLLSTVGFEVVGGWRLGPNVRYFRQFENGQVLFNGVSFNLGLKNKDWQGGYNLWFRYNPYHLGDASIRIGRAFYSINSFDAYLNQLKISNYIVHDYVNTFHRRELFNGFYVSTELNFSNRQPLSGYDATSILNEVLDEEDALEFEGYQTLISHLQLSYTPKQKFMSEPNRKVVLGSNYPTFNMVHRKGWSNVMTSDINFDYVEFSIEQNLLLGTLGNSRYTIMAGDFINTKDLRYIDLKRFRQSDPYLYSDPLRSFQLLDTALSTTEFFVEGHYIHHFNGAMINNIPLVKKLRIQTVAGAGFMWSKESNYRHEEIFGGIERIFKLGPRRRLRIGLFGVLGQSNFAPPKADWKISFDIIDMWKREWSY